MPSACLPMVYSCNGPGFILSVTSWYVSESCSQAPHSHLFFRLAKSSSLSLSSEGEVLQLSHSHFECLSWIVGPQMHSSKWGLTSGEEREIITSVNLLALILLVQSVMLPASFAAQARCWHQLSLLSAQSPRASSAQLLPSQLVPSLSISVAFSFPDAELHIFAYWISQVSWSPFIQPA